MGTAYFISDAHLGLGPSREERAKEDTLLSFLEAIRRDASHLVIAGDLFDAWIEYRTVIPKGHHRILAALDGLVAGGVETHFLAGNHDCWYRDYFSAEMGILTHRDPFELNLQGKRILVHHGDGLSDKDTGYRILKSIVRHPLSVWLFSWVHPDLGLRLARGSSRTSRHHTAQKHYGERDRMAAFAEERISAGVDIVVMGHNHEPALMEHPGRGVYLNLGDWITHHTYAELAGGRITLKEWKD